MNSKVSNLILALKELTEQKFKRVVRGGKTVRKLQCRPGFKASKGRCVRITPQEQRKRKIGQRSGARKRKATRARSIQKRARSMRRRTWK